MKKERKPQVSIIIPYYNDIETLEGTIKSLYDTIDIKSFEVIVVCDGGKFKLGNGLPKNMQHIEHPFNLGVGAAFDTGVRVARSDNLILMGADIRFQDNGWGTRMMDVVKKHEKAIVCTECQSHTTSRKEYGADIIFKVSQENLTKNHPRFSVPNYRAVLEGKWRPKTGRGVYQIPSLMGAFYGVKKDWYDYIRGCELHYKWGVLEPLMSLKTWLLGGEVLIDTDNVTEHIWRAPQRDADFSALSYNQQMLAAIVFGSYGIKYANFLWEGRGAAYERGAEMAAEKKEAIEQMAYYLQQNATMSPEELEKKMVDLSFQYHRENNKYLNPLEE
jgi:glycosyltransferase involved in cell wall biosynthesis